MTAQRHGAGTEQDIAAYGIAEEVLELLVFGAIGDSEHLRLPGLDAFGKCAGVEVIAHDFGVRTTTADGKVDLTDFFLALALSLRGNFHVFLELAQTHLMAQLDDCVQVIV